MYAWNLVVIDGVIELDTFSEDCLRDKPKKVKSVQASYVPLSTPLNKLAFKASALKLEKMQCSVYLFGRINISNATPSSSFLACPHASPPVSSDSKSFQSIQHSKPHRVPLGGDPDRFVQPHIIGVSAGPYHAAVVTATGDVYTWGSGFAGQLASGRRDNAVWPQVVKASVYSRSLHSLRVDQVACGGAHTLMCFDDGTVASCGCDRDGQLGQGTVYECSVPLAVAGLASRKIKQVACGGMHTLLLDEAGKLLAFGSGSNGRLGLGNTTTIAKPAEITALASVTAKSIACGWSSSMCIASSAAPGRSVGLVYTWGHGECGRLGHGIDQDVWSPRVVDELRRCGCHVTQCSMGHQHAAVKTGTGDVWIWGSGARGQLGLGSLSALGTSLPSKMPWPSSSAGSVVKVLCGAAHTVVLTSFGKVLVCGAADCGQLGLGSLQADVPTPTVVLLPAFACDIGVGWECTIVVTHVRERSDDTGASSVSSGSRLRGVSDCSESDALAPDAPSPSLSELSASVATIHSTSAAPLAAVSECPLAACIAGARMGGDGHTRYFEFRCVFGDLSPWNSYKRYSECLKLSDKIRADPCAPNFPAKTWGLSRLLADEEELAAREEERQQALQSWFDFYLEQGSSFEDYGKFLSFFEVGRQQKLQGGEGACEARSGVAPDVTLHEGALRTDATFVAQNDAVAAAAVVDSRERSISFDGSQGGDQRDRSVSSVSLEGRGEGRNFISGERDGRRSGITDSDDFTTEGGGSVMATPQKQRLCEEEDPDIANLILQTPDSEKGLGPNYDTIPGSISLFEGERDGVVMRRSPGNAAGGALDDSDRFNSISSVATISSQAPPRSRTPPHVRAMGPRVPMQLDVSAFTAPRIISTSLFCGWSSLWGGGGDSAAGSRTPSPQNGWDGSRRSGADALLNLWGSSSRWLDILEPNWKVASQKSQVRSFWRRGLPPHIRGKVWKKAIGNNLSVETDLYEYNRNQARAVFRPDAATAASSASATQTFSGSGSFRSPSPWISQDERSSSAQQFATRGGFDFSAREQGKGMRRVSSSGLLLLAEEGGSSNSHEQATWFDWSAASGAGVDTFGSRTLASVPEMVRNVPQDVQRTMQHMQLFQEDCPYERDLRDVLGAFAFMRQNVGYVQSMSYIAAMFLLYSDTPFDAFVAFSNVIVRPFFQNYFKRREEHLLQRHHAFQRIFEGGASHRTPAFDCCSFDVNYSKSADTLQKVLSEWCFALVSHVTRVQCLEPRLVSRVWDLYLCDGAVAAYKIAIALLRLRGPGVSKCPIEEVVKRLTAMASHEESDLFDLYSKVELPTGSKAHIEELEGERDHAQ